MLLCSFDPPSEFPPSIFQDRFFSADRPQYMNYASIGSVIGHEITHGFDDEGRQYDLNGNLFNWWNPGTERQFLKKAQCIIDQYGDYTDIKANLSVRLSVKIPRNEYKNNNFPLFDLVS